MTKTEAIARLNTIVENSVTHEYCEFRIKANDWEKNGKNRTYLSIVEASKDSKISKHYSEKKYGYVDNITGEYFAEKYGDIRNDFTFRGSRF